MADDNYKEKCEYGTFLKNVPQDVIDRNLKDPILRKLACWAQTFTKSTVIEVARSLGIKMRSSSAWIDQFLADKVGYSIKESNVVMTFWIYPEWWLEFMRVETCEEVEKNMKGLLGNSDNHNLSYAVNAYLHGTDYLYFLKTSQKYPLTARLNNRYMDYLYEVSLHDSMYGLIEDSNLEVKIGIVERYCRGLYDYSITQRDIDLVMKIYESGDDRFLKDNLCDLTGRIAYYYDFLRNADLKMARQRAAGNAYVTNFLDGVMLMQEGNYNKAVKSFTSALKGHGRWFTMAGMNYYYSLSLVYSDSAAAKKKLETISKDKGFDTVADGSLFVIVSCAIRKNEFNPREVPFFSQGLVNDLFTVMMLKYYQRMENIEDSVVDTLLDHADEHQLKAVQLEMTKVFDRYKDREEELIQSTGMRPLLQPYVVKPEWESLLDDLLILNGSNGSATKSAPSSATERISYEVNLYNFNVQPRLQKSKDGVTWSAGRNIALKKFAAGDVSCMTLQDSKVAACVEEYSYGWYGNTSYRLDGTRAIAALIGHPYVYEEGTDIHLDVVEEKMQVAVNSISTGFIIAPTVNLYDVNGGYVIDTKMKPVVRVVKVDNLMMKTVQSLADMFMPLAAKDKLTKLMENLSSKIVVMGDLLKDSENIKDMKSHSETIVQLKPAGEEIKCFLTARPFGSVPPLCKPGKGMEIVTASIGGKTVRTKRNIKKETENYNAVQSLLVNYEDDGDNSWSLSPAECLDLLDRLRDMTKQCVVEWPEGERFRVTCAPVQSSMFNVSVNSLSNWFEMSGEVQVSTDMKMKISDLMGRLKDSVGNFIRLKDDDYVRISDDLRRYLDNLSRIAVVDKGKMRVSNFNALQLEGMEESGMTFNADEAFRSLLNRINESQEVQCKIPKNIQADLRSYQKEGYEWMSRLAHWGAGALLADDMGLGKTVQTITLLLSRASMGPQLVIVPTSLILNWQDEIARFAPNLSVLILNRQGEDRESMVKNAKAYDVVITTYGLLITEEETLTSRSWTTIVLDEAHTIKNKDTKMSKVAMELKSDFRVLLTGTPLQNHVSEMWNLMQFANPGLLGSFQQFNDRFLLPIERDHNKDVQRVLRRVISPFILRRTKNDVLSELPEKTEITIKVDLSPEEMAFYDNIREEAIANLADLSSTAMQALAEITRLRQAACNTRLVNKKVELPSSKLESFMSLMENLHANHHRALVFSQFTSHLALVRERLDKEGVEYLYLDGSTSAKERIHLVEEFQHGDMPLFLISLKAGGLGLNLTAADYVIHLDPWWNPAIEEQASDRAYRIGQKKPVTVYRLIAAGTIEEKILDLHATKKNMADALLEGGDVSASMSRDEMIKLLKEGSVL